MAAKKVKNKKTNWKTLNQFEEKPAQSNSVTLAKPKLDKSVVVGLDDGVEKEMPFPIAIAGFEEVPVVGKDQLQTFAIDKQIDTSNAHQVFVKMTD
ncbi:hypothetical protein PHJA_000083100 [Phtheirospermum japonicum]|uniref:Uncharacterized protein n=1 Tax=Phtheirospermum japonicum TaxID=374723 RepID=A0A830AZ02_9LAMI|nr:hypothetical protein PHJA_000083100 [Phtheirospermum japonicum]